MVSFIHDIPLIEFFLVLFMLLLGSIALQALVHKQDLTQEDKKFVTKLISIGFSGLALLAVGLKVIALFVK